MIMLKSYLNKYITILFSSSPKSLFRFHSPLRLQRCLSLEHLLQATRRRILRKSSQTSQTSHNMVSGVCLCHIYICSRNTQTLILIEHSLVISSDDRMSVVNVALNYQTPSPVSCVNVKRQSQKCQTTPRLSVNFSLCKSPLRTLNLLVPSLKKREHLA